MVRCFHRSNKHDHSTRIQGPRWFISSICTRPFDKNIWSSFIYSYFCAQLFDQKLSPSSIYFFYWHTTIRRKFMIFFHLFFLCAQLFDQKLGSTLIYFFYCTRPLGQKLGSSLIYLSYLYMTIGPKIRVVIDLFLSFAHDHSTQLCDLFWIIFSLCTTIRPKIRVLFNSFFFYLYTTIRPKLWITLTL